MLKENLLNIYNKFNSAKEQKKDRLSDQYGFSYQEDVTLPDAKRTLSCLIRGFMLFLIVYTPISIINHAFEIKEAPAILPIILFVFAILVGFFNYNGITRSIGYIGFFIIFSFMSFSFFSYVNSGLNAILNIIFENAAYDLNLDAIRTYEEIIKIRSITIPFFYFYIGIVLLVINNFILNDFMSAPFVLVLTFPFLFLGMYFDYTPKTWHYLSFAFLLMTITIMKNTNQYNMPDNKKKFSITRRTKKKREYISISSGKLMWQTGGLIGGLLVILFIITSVFFPANRFRTPTEWKTLKESTKDQARLIFKDGLFSLFFNNTQGVGVSDGSLGAPQVKPSYTKDLSITFAPYNYESIYLKAYVGTIYANSEWKSYLLCDDRTYEEMENKTYSFLKSEFSQTDGINYEKDSSIISAKISIEANDTFNTFYPYTSVINSSLFHYNTDNNVSYHPFWYDPRNRNDLLQEYTYYHASKEYIKNFDYDPKQMSWKNTVFSSKSIPELDNLYIYPLSISNLNQSVDDMINNIYLSLYDKDTLLHPDLLDETLTRICTEENFHGSALEIVSQIQDYFKNNYTYSLNPGSYYPNKNDYVTYFLNEHHYGYCEHFATAGTLLLRKMGIPARFVGGYSVSFSDLMNNYEILEDEAVTDWLKGDIPLDTTSVLKVDVLDASAHAWVEIWLPGYGWYPVEMTTAREEPEDEDNFAFWDKLSNFTPSIDTTPLENLLKIDWTFTTALLTKAIEIALILGILLFIFYIIYMLYQKLNAKANKPYHKGNNKHLLLRYKLQCLLLHELKLTDKDMLLHSEYEELLLKYQNRDNLNALCKLLNDAAFGNDLLVNDQLSQGIKLLNEGETLLLKKATLFTKIRWYIHKKYLTCKLKLIETK